MARLPILMSEYFVKTVPCNDCLHINTSSTKEHAFVVMNSAKIEYTIFTLAANKWLVAHAVINSYLI